MRLGYNTNGFLQHRLADAAAVLAETGYEAVAITLGPTLLDPPDRRGVNACARRIRAALKGTGLTPTIETGAGFVLDPRRKHQPTLLSADPQERRKRVEYLLAAVETAAGVGAEAVSFWSGTPDEETEPEILWDRLCGSLEEVLYAAGRLGVRLAFEPEPGMWIERMADFARLMDHMNDDALGLTLDVGHVHCLDDGEPAEWIRTWREKLWNVHVEDMRRERHEHLMFGEGEMNFGPIFTALREIDYRGPVHVELSRHSHQAVDAARRAYALLRRFVGATVEQRSAAKPTGTRSSAGKGP